MGRKLDLFVPPFRRPIDAGDQGRTVHASQVAEYKRVAGLGLVRGTLGEAKMPGSVLLPGMPLEEGVLIIRTWLHVAPIAIQHVLLGVDQPTAVVDCGPVQDRKSVV